jgi:hypothetical protein
MDPMHLWTIAGAIYALFFLWFGALLLLALTRDDD